jgi:uncharacterized membrane protein YecN with MAPEG domain
MSTSITAFYGGMLGILFCYLSVLVIRVRLNQNISIGDGDNKQLQQLIRAQGNFSEYAPIILLLLFIAEVNSSQPLILHCVGAALLAGRFLHAFGLRRHEGASWQRATGMLLTFAALIGAAVLNILVLYP